MNKLSQYIADRGMTRSAFARMIGISGPYLSEILGDKKPKRPSLDLAFKIEAVTNGAVPASSWVSNSDAATVAEGDAQ